MNSVIDMLGSVKQTCSLDVSCADFECGKEMYSGNCISFYGAFSKQGRPHIELGDAVNFVTSAADDRDHSININVNKFLVGDRVNIVTEGDSWYSSNCPHRCITVGDDTTLIINASVETFDGLDKHVPSNCIVSL